MEKIHWSEMYHTHFKRKPIEPMLCEGGYTAVVKCRLKRESLKAHDVKERLVVFDSDYCCASVMTIPCAKN